MIRYKTILTFFILFSIFPLWSIKSGQSQEIQTKEGIISTFYWSGSPENGEKVWGDKNQTKHRPESFGIDL